MSKDEEGYNGWANKPTWLVKLWIDNEEGDYLYWRDAAQEALGLQLEDRSEASDAPATEDEKREAAYALAKRLEDEIEAGSPDVKGFWADMVGYSIATVNWDEVAEAMIEELD